MSCHGTNIVKFGKTPEGKQRYKCREDVCSGQTFILDYSRPGSLRSVKQQIVDMAMNGSEVRDTARVLHVSPNTVTRELKKESQLLPVNLPVLKQLNPEQVEVEIRLASLEEKPNRPESERFGDVELCGEEIKSSMAMVCD